MPITAVLGEQRGDEGKGRFTDELAAEHDIVARFNGGPNAGHSVVLPDGEEFALHLLPSGIIHPHTMNVIGNGTVVDPVKLVSEIDQAAKQGIEVTPNNLLISSAAHLLMPHHIRLDQIREAGSDRQGTTGSGIAPAYADKAMRSGLRMESIANEPEKINKEVIDGFRDGLGVVDAYQRAELFMDAAERLGPYVTDTALFLNRALAEGRSILAEGAQAFLLDLDHGMYPATTSSTTTAGGIFTGLGIAPRHLEHVLGVSKAVPSHVGDGPFVTEITDAPRLAILRGPRGMVDSEFGTTTGRERRIGHLDLPVMRRAQMINGTNEMALTKLDKVPLYGKAVLICVAYHRKGKRLEIAPDAAYKMKQCEPEYEELPTWSASISDARRLEDLPVKARQYLAFIQDKIGVPITRIGVGPRRDEVIKVDSV